MLFSQRSLVCFLLFLLTGCATLDAGRGKSVELDAPIDAKMGMIVGRVDDSKSGNKITYVTIWEQKTKMRAGYKGIPVRMFDDGTFVAVNVPPGSYYIPILVSDGNGASIMDMAILQPFEVKPGKVTYWGSYKVVFKKGSATFGLPSFVNLTKSGDTDRKMAFTQVLQAAKGTRWEKIVSAGM